MSALGPLPIDTALPQLRSALTGGVSAVVQAPPAAGKTTRVPIALLDEPWLADRRILMLEPRRIAARAAARRMSDTVGDATGGLVGFRTRGESVVSERTRVEVVTEGILTRMLLADPTLDGVGLIIFDEFHERSIHADLGLALTLHTRRNLREDLRVIVMSATLDDQAVADLLGGAPVVVSPGLSFPVEIRHAPPRPDTRPEAAVASAVREELRSYPGDVLAFLPGAGEIHRALALLEGVDADVIALHGTLSPSEQDRAIRPSPPGRRKVVLATSIAETSLTIEGVRVVVDSGWSRVPRYSPRTGMTTLATVRVSLASAEQRRGRAGRVAPGRCVRLWSEQEHHALVPRSRPEILEADLAPLALDLATAGITDPGELPWLDPPPAGAFREARSLLGQLGALNDAGTITPHGRALERRSMHPRLAHMVLRGLDLGAGDEACELAALLHERDVLRGHQGVPDADIRNRLDILRGSTTRAGVDQETLRRARREVRACRDHGGSRRAGGVGAGVGVGVLVALAYPDRIAQRRPGSVSRYLLRNGVGVTLDPESLRPEHYLAVAEIEGRSREGRIRLAAPLSLAELERHFGGEVEPEEVVAWDPASGTVLARYRERLGALVLREGPAREPDPALVTAALLEGIRSRGIRVLPWTESAQSIQDRVAFVHRLEAGWPDLSDPVLTRSLEHWLGPRVLGLRRLDQLAELDLADALRALLGPQRARELEAIAPTHVRVPSGSRVPIDYQDSALPVVAVRLQEVFGWSEAPLIPCRPTGSGDARPRGILADDVLRGAKGSEGPVSASLLAGRSPGGGAHRSGEAPSQAGEPGAVTGC